jgi:hypothetical protein
MRPPFLAHLDGGSNAVLHLVHRTVRKPDEFPAIVPMNLALRIAVQVRCFLGIGDSQRLGLGVVVPAMIGVYNLHIVIAVT